MLASLLNPPLPQHSKDHQHWGQLYGVASGLALANAAQSASAPLLLITADMISANEYYTTLQCFKDKSLEVAIFPDWETLPYDTFSPHEDIISARLGILSRLPQWQCGILIVPMRTLMHPLMPREYLQAHSLVLKNGQHFVREIVHQDLIDAGYRAVEQVMQHGEFALRGAIMDLYPMGSEIPYRIDLLDRQIDSIRTFDPETQRSLQKFTHVNLLPAKEYPFTEESIRRFCDAWKAHFHGSPNNYPIYASVSKGIAPSGIDYYLPLFYQKVGNLFDYLPSASIIVHGENVYQAAEQFCQEVKQRYQQYQHDVTRPLLAPQQLFLSVDKVFSLCKQHAQISLHTDKLSQDARNINFNTRRLPDVTIDTQSNTPLNKLSACLAQTPQRILFCVDSLGRREALLELFASAPWCPETTSNWQTFLAEKKTPAITVAALPKGINSIDPDIQIISEAQLYGERVIQRRSYISKKVVEDNGFRSLVELQPGMAVVHIDHGIGRYLGLNSIKTGEITTEFVTLEYAEGARLHLPVADLTLLSRYSGGDADNVLLHYLGTQQWRKAKQKAAQRARDVAAELLDLYARRSAKAVKAYAPINAQYHAFAAAFPFTETPDQAHTIEAVIGDLTQAIPMDRVVCGDVGFGKTEVAMRAAFLAVQNNQQVAILVPTTLLAEQHYRNFKDRFANQAVTIEMLSRFRSKQQQQHVLYQLKQGTVDIVIGTHKLLQENVQFADLGLLVIDEEHRFGVRQKERIKALRTDVNMLTLTATPIPRTLNMSLSKIRELSLIATPPARRLSIKTFVQTWNKQTIREALWREISRGGQVYFLHNKIATIEQSARVLAELVPEVEIAIAHGQMRERELEQIMADFYHQRFQVLVCTTIIENGIDIPSTNTIIIDRADKLGLAQLHQLRGRVGRSHHQAYAYLLIPDQKQLTADAQRRLEVIAATEDLGAGFTLATHDLEIRGAGQLLGEEQSGQIEAVGFSLYMDYLDRAVQALQTEHTKKPLMQHSEVDLQLTAIIPESYVYDVHTRLLLYERIASAKDQTALQDLQVEMIDRFGLLPEESKNLFKLMEIKLQAAALGIVKIEMNERGGSIEFAPQPHIEPMKIIQLVQQHSNTYRLQGSQRLLFELPSTTAAQRFAQCHMVLQALR